MFLPLVLLSIDEDEKQNFYTNLCQEYYPVMAHTARKTMNSADGIDDVVQKSLVKLLHHYEKLRSLERNHLTGYIVVTVKSVAIDSLREKQRENEQFFYGNTDFMDTVADRDTPEQAVIQKEERAAKMNALKQLPESQRDLILYKYLLNKPNSELAEIYHTTEDNIRQMLSRTRRRLCKILENMQ